MYNPQKYPYKNFVTPYYNNFIIVSLTEEELEYIVGDEEDEEE